MVDTANTHMSINMNRQTKMTDEAVAARAFLPWLMLLLFSVLVGLFAFQSVSIRRVERSIEPNLAQYLAQRPAQASLPPHSKSLIWWSPLRPQLANALYVATAVRNNERRFSSDASAMLRQLGWRNTAVVQNRLSIAANRQDINEIVELSDSLLRRNKLVDQASQLLMLMEQAGATRKKLLEALSTAPGWRQAYFSRALLGGAMAEVSAKARLQLFNELRQNNINLEADEIVGIVNGLFALEAYEKAATVNRFLHPVPSHQLLNRFSLASQVARYSSGGLGAENPFDWQLHEGVYFDLEKSKRNDQILLSIDRTIVKSGSFAERGVFFGNKRRQQGFAIDVIGSENNGYRALSLIVTCSGRPILPENTVINRRGFVSFFYAPESTCVAGRLKMVLNDESLRGSLQDARIAGGATEPFIINSVNIRDLS